VKIISCWYFGYAISSNLTFLLTHHSSRAPGSNWEKGKRRGRERGRKKGGCGNGRKWGKGVERKGQGGKGPPADFRYSLRYSAPQMLNSSGCLAGMGVKCGEGRKEGEGKNRKGEIGNGGMALAPRKKFLRHPCFSLFLLNWFIDGKLLIKTDTSFQILLHLYLIRLLQKIFSQS